MNAITAYVFSELSSAVLSTIRVHYEGRVVDLQRYIFLSWFAPIGNLSFASLLYSIAFLLVCAIPVALLYKQKIYLKI